MSGIASRLRDLAHLRGTRVERAQAAVRVIREAAPYRDGPEPPTYPRFPLSKGLNGAAVGTIDVEADRVNAFTAADERLLAECAEALRWLWMEPV